MALTPRRRFTLEATWLGGFFFFLWAVLMLYISSNQKVLKTFKILSVIHIFFLSNIYEREINDILSCAGLTHQDFIS